MTTHARKKGALFPSLMAADPLHLAAVIEKLEPYCQGFHLDVMDDQLVPNIAFGPATINAIGRIANKPCWVHLMVTHPAPWLSRLTLPPQSIISFHLRSKVNPATFIAAIKRKGWIASIVINPGQSLTTLKPFINKVTHITIMGVKPGFSGQRFIPATYRTLAQLQQLIGPTYDRYQIGIDGGVSSDNIGKLYTQGATEFVLGSSLFSTRNPARTLRTLDQLVERL